jgi:hypothetical protein
MERKAIMRAKGWNLVSISLFLSMFICLTYLFITQLPTQASAAPADVHQVPTLSNNDNPGAADSSQALIQPIKYTVQMPARTLIQCSECHVTIPLAVLAHGTPASSPQIYMPLMQR